MTTVDGARHSIENLLFLYASAADDRDVDAVADLFRDAAIDFAGQHAEGKAAVHALFVNAFRHAEPTRHLVSNVRIELDDSGGRPTAAVTAHYTRWPVRASSAPLGLGDYTAAMSETGSGWRFDRFVVRRLWSRPRSTDVA